MTRAPRPSPTPKSAEQSRAEVQAIISGWKKEREDQAQGLRRRLRREHPNAGKTPPMPVGRWVWADETEDAWTCPPSYPTRPHQSPLIEAKRRHRQHVIWYTRHGQQQIDDLEGGGDRFNSGTTRSDLREVREIEEDVERRWANALRRMRKKAKRLATVAAPST